MNSPKSRASDADMVMIDRHKLLSELVFRFDELTAAASSAALASRRRRMPAPTSALQPAAWRANRSRSCGGKASPQCSQVRKSPLHMCVCLFVRSFVMVVCLFVCFERKYDKFAESDEGKLP